MASFEIQTNVTCRKCGGSPGALIGGGGTTNLRIEVNPCRCILANDPALELVNAEKALLDRDQRIARLTKEIAELRETVRTAKADASQATKNAEGWMNEHDRMQDRLHREVHQVIALQDEREKSCKDHELWRSQVLAGTKRAAEGLQILRAKTDGELEAPEAWYEVTQAVEQIATAGMTTGGTATPTPDQPG